GTPAFRGKQGDLRAFSCRARWQFQRRRAWRNRTPGRAKPAFPETSLRCRLALRQLPQRLRPTLASGGNLLDLLHLRNEVVKQVLNAVLQRCGGGGTAGTGSFHVEEHRTVLKAAERDVAAILSDGGPYPRVEQFLDRQYDLFI